VNTVLLKHTSLVSGQAKTIEIDTSQWYLMLRLRSVSPNKYGAKIILMIYLKGQHETHF